MTASKYLHLPILLGHETDIVAVVVSAELGLVMSASYQGKIRLDCSAL